MVVPREGGFVRGGVYQMDMLGLGTCGSFTVPEKRLSRWGS